MKKIIFLIPALVIFAIYSCDKIDGPTRESVSIDTTCSFEDDNTPAIKKVLVEDFTGHNCGNCPEGGIILNDSMRHKYNDRLVVITVHAGDYANICPGMSTCPPNAPAGSFAMDYKTTTGNEWNTFFGVFFYPAGMVDRIDHPNDHLKPKDSWDEDAQARLNLPAKARIKIVNTYNDNDRKVRTCIETKFLEDLAGDYKLSVVLTEDSVIDWQVWYGHNPELVPNYVHHHLLRATLNTDYGVVVGTSSTVAETAVVNGYSLILDSAWNEDQCSIVAFIYDATTFEVMQVEEVKVR
jgi:hypothetical protein